MKKFFTITAIVALCAVLLSLGACTNRNATITVSSCWANNEKLTYSVYDTDKPGAPKVGTVEFDLKANIGDGEKTLVFGGEERTHGGANVRLKQTLVTADYRVETIVLAKDYTVLATNKTVTDLTAEGNGSYTLESYHDGKNYVYHIQYADGTEKSDKINVGNSNYTDNEFLYFYIRCYESGSLPSKIAIADPLHDKALEIGCTASGTEKVAVECTDSVIGAAVDCTKVIVSLNENPVGRSITAYFVSDSLSFGTFGFKSKKFPAKIIENNMIYILNGYEVY